MRRDNKTIVYVYASRRVCRESERGTARMVGGARSFQCLRSGQLPFMRPGKHPWWWVTRTSRQAYVIGSVWLAFSVSLLVQFVESDVHRGWFKWFSLGAGL